MAYFVGTVVWVIVLIVIIFLGYLEKDSLFGIGAIFIALTLGAIATVLYLIYLALVVIFKRKN
jgi:hypothetical protein